MVWSCKTVLLMKRFAVQINSMNTRPDSSNRTPDSSEPKPKGLAGVKFFARAVPLALRWSLAVTFLSAVADRFGIWGPPGAANVSWGDWSHFVAYTEKVNSFLPTVVAPYLAAGATAAEFLLGVALIAGVFPRTVAWASTMLLVLFAGSMTLSFGIKAPLNYSVLVDAAAAFALSVWPVTRNTGSAAACS